MIRIKGVGGGKEVFESSIFLGLIQLFNIVVPLLVLPYLSRTLEVEEYGAVMVSMAVIVVAFVITDYGFSLSATSRIAQHRGDVEFINELISTVFSAKLFLVGVAFLFVVGLSFSSFFIDYYPIFLVSLFAIVAQAYQPVWLFQGLGLMKYFTLYVVLSKFIYLGGVFLLVKGQGDGMWAMVSWSLAQIIGVIAGLSIMIRKGFKFSFSPFSRAWQELKFSAEFFWSRVAVAVYTSASSVIVGTVSLQQAAIYSAAEQGYKAGQTFAMSLSQALYPFMTKEKNWKVFFITLAFTAPILLLGAAFVSWFAEGIVVWVFGEEFGTSAVILEIMMLTLCINYVCIVFGYPAFSALGRLDCVNKSVIWGCLLFLVVLGMLYFSESISAINVALAVLASEIMVMMYRIYRFFSIFELKSGTL